MVTVFSEFGHGDCIHHRLDMSLIVAGDMALVHARVAGCLELVLIDVAVLVSDRGRDTVLGCELGKRNDLRSQVNEVLFVGSLHELARSRAEES